MAELPEDAIDLGVTERDHQGGFGGFGKTTAAPRMRDLPGDRYRMVAIPEPAPPEPTITELCQEINAFVYENISNGGVSYNGAGHTVLLAITRFTAKIAELSEGSEQLQPLDRGEVWSFMRSRVMHDRGDDHSMAIADAAASGVADDFCDRFGVPAPTAEPEWEYTDHRVSTRVIPHPDQHSRFRRCKAGPWVPLGDTEEQT